jgi:hypothetical protein
MDTELKRLEQQSAQEESRLRDIGIQLDLGEIEGAQLAARDAEARRAAATQQGMQGVVSLAGQVAAAAPLYAKSQAARQFKKVSTANPNLQAEVARTGNLMGVDTSKVAEMDATQFQDFMTTNFNADALKVLPTRLQDTTIVSSLQPKPIQLFDTNFGQDPLTFEPIKLYGQ